MGVRRDGNAPGGPRDVPPGEDGEENLTCSLGWWFICAGRERESLPSARVCSAKGSRVHVVTEELSAREGRGQPPRPDGGHVFRLSVFRETSNLLYPKKIILYVKAAVICMSSFLFSVQIGSSQQEEPSITEADEELLQSHITTFGCFFLPMQNAPQPKESSISKCNNFLQLKT